MFGSFGAGFGSFGAGVGGLLPSFTNITSWLKTPTADGKTLDNSKGADATLTGVNCLQYTEAGAADYVSLTNVITTSNTWELEFDVNWSSFGNPFSGVSFVSNADQSRWFRINGSDGNNLFLEGKIGSTTFREKDLSADVSLSLNVTYRIKTVWSGTNVALYIDGVLANTYVWGNNVENNTFSSIGRPVTTNGTGKIANWKFTNNGVVEAHIPLQEGSGTKAYDVSGNGNHGLIVNSTWTTADGIESWNHQYGFDTDIFKGYRGYWDLPNSALGTWTQNESNLTLTGNTGTSSRIRQVVDGMASGDTLVVSGTIVQTGGSGAGADVGISASSAGWVEGTVLLGGQVGTYTFSETLNALSSNCDIQFIAVNAANIVISDLKFTVVRKIPALNFKTTQVVAFDGVADEVGTNYSPLGGDLVIDARIKADTVTGQKTLYGVNGNSGFWFRISNGEWQLYSRNAYIFTTSTGIDPAVGNIYDTRVEYNYSTGDWIARVKLSTDSTYTTVGTGNRLPPIINFEPVILGQKGSTGYFDGQYHSFKITEGGVTQVEYDFQNDVRTTNIVDSSGIGNDGIVSTGSGGLDSFWGQRVADSAGSLVSADYATANTTISNPAGFVHNGSECGVAMVTNSLTSTQLFAIDNSTATETFVRKDNGNIVQILDYSAPLTGDDLTRTRSYVG